MRGDPCETLEVWKTFIIKYEYLNWPLKERNIWLDREESMFVGLVGKARVSGERVSRGTGGERSMVFGTKYSEVMRSAQKIYMLQILDLVISSPWPFHCK